MFLFLGHKQQSLGSLRTERQEVFWTVGFVGADGKWTINYNRDINGESKHKFQFKTLTLFNSITRYIIYNSVNSLIDLWPKRRSMTGANNTKMGSRITPIKVDSNY